MLGVGTGELLLILIIAVLVVGPEKMVEYAGQAGRMIAKFRAMTSDVTSEFRDAFSLEADGEEGKATGDVKPVPSPNSKRPRPTGSLSTVPHPLLRWPAATWLRQLRLLLQALRQSQPGGLGGWRDGDFPRDARAVTRRGHHSGWASTRSP